MAPVKPLVLVLVALSALVLATVVASIVANQLLELSAPLGWWGLLLLVWPTGLFLASSRQHDL